MNLHRLKHPYSKFHKNPLVTNPDIRLGSLSWDILYINKSIDNNNYYISKIMIDNLKWIRFEGMNVSLCLLLKCLFCFAVIIEKQISK
jgi:hypothetical protein